MHEREKTYKTTCCYCGVGCGMEVKKHRDGKISATGDRAHPVNRGMLCSKGMNLHYTAMDPTGRLLYPMERRARGGPLDRINWDTAIDHAAGKFKELIKTHGPDAVGFYISGQCLTEEYYLANKIVKGFIGTNNIDTNSRLCMSSAVSAYKLALGEDSVPGCYEDLELADTFLIAGANPAWCHPILFRRIEAHKAKNAHVKIIVVDPRRTQTAEAADLHLQILPGTDIVLFHAIARGLIENGFLDEEFIRDHTEGFEPLKELVMKRTLQEAAAICGIKFTDVYKAVKYIGFSGGFISLWAMGLNQSVVGVHKNLALINLSLITGKIGKPGSGPFSLTGQANAMGGREVGGMATLLSAHRNLKNPLHRQEIADYWGVPSVPERPGLTATEMFRALKEGKMKAIWIICTNPMVSLPDVNLAAAALRQAEYVVVQDMSLNADTLQYADLVLPAATWLEKEGTMTNSERRISHLSKVLDPPGEALADQEILLRFAAAMGWADHFCYQTPQEIYAEHAGLTRHTRIDVSGLDYDWLKTTGSIQWPVPRGAASGTPRLFTDHVFDHPGGRARIHAVPEGNLSEPLTDEHPLILTTGRIRDQWHTMTRTGKVNNLKQHIGMPFLEIHPADALKRNITAGDPVVIQNKRGRVQVTAVVTDTIKRGVVFLPMHWGKIVNQELGRANNLTSMLVDPVSGQPDFKFSAVGVARYRKPVERIVLLGEGEEVIAFLQAYRKLNDTDEITWFCGRSPAYQSPALWYDQLVAPIAPTGSEDFGDVVQPLHVSLQEDVAILGIDPVKKILLGNDEKEYPYDKLILSGIRDPMCPPAGFILLDSVASAHRLRMLLRPGITLVLSGDDPLLLSLAAHFSAAGLEIHLVIPGEGVLSSLMDETAGNLMETLLLDAGVRLYRGEQVVSVLGEGSGREALLKSGGAISCQAVVAVPSRGLPDPFAGSLGLQRGKGIRVNEYLQTEVADVFSFGSAAGRGEAFTPEAGRRQACALADYLHGNLLGYYRGTIPFYTFTLCGIGITIGGVVRFPEGDARFEQIAVLDKSQFYYKKCVIRDDRLVGVLLMGDDQEMTEYKTLMENGSELGAKRSQLLRSQGGASVMKGRMVCSCWQVGEENIAQAIRDGCKTVEQIGDQTRAGTKCGSCKPELTSLLKQNR